MDAKYAFLLALLVSVAVMAGCVQQKQGEATTITTTQPEISSPLGTQIESAVQTDSDLANPDTSALDDVAEVL